MNRMRRSARQSSLFDSADMPHDTELIIGVDEAGRGPLAGPVVIAAVVFCVEQTSIDGLDDSKKLTEKKREHLYPQIIEQALAYNIQIIDVDTIDRLNILQATFLGMRQAAEQVFTAVGNTARCCIRIDGNAVPKPLPCRAESLIGGDALDHNIMAASILAKVTRDRLMQDADKAYPAYGFARHKGYGSQAHLLALQQHGPCPLHRRSYAPVRQAIHNASS